MLRESDAVKLNWMNSVCDSVVVSRGRLPTILPIRSANILMFA
mgnify:CR=1 FL=1